MVAILPLFLCATAVWGATYTVTPGSSWNNRKTSLLPGDTLTFTPQTSGQPYTYTMSGTNAFVLNGNPGAPIIVQGAPGEKITLLQNAEQNVVELTGQYFVFRNFFLTAGSSIQGAIGLRLKPNVSHSVIDKVTVYNVPETAFTANTGGGYYNNVTFSNSEAYNVGGTGECFYVGCQSSTSAYVCQFVNGHLINNYCHDTCKPNACTGGSMGSGYQVKGWGSYNNVVKNNVCARVNSVCVLLYDDFDLGANVVDSNWIYGSVTDAGIQVSAGAIIRNNVIVNNQNGIVVTTNTADLKPGTSNRKIVLVGNTVVNNNGIGIKIPTLSPTAGSRVANNVVIEDSGNAFSAGSQTGVTWSKNAYYGGAAPVSGQVLVSSSMNVFVNPASYNYHPKSGSGLLAAGSALSTSDSRTDFLCVPRNPTTPTIGAYENTTGPALTLGFLPACGAFAG